MYAVIIGVFLPIPFWWWQRKRPNSWNTLISTPIALNAVTYVPPATGINYSSWITVGFVFQYWIKRKNFAWWSKFNYATSAALDIGALCVCAGERRWLTQWLLIGTLICLLFIFFTLQVSPCAAAYEGHVLKDLQFPKNGTIELNWWGNNVWKNSMCLPPFPHLLPR